MLSGAHVIVYTTDPDAKENNHHELYLMCDDVAAFVGEMKVHGVSCGPLQDQGWGVLTQLTLPGGGTLGIYQPRHARPPDMRVGARPSPSSAIEGD